MALSRHKCKIVDYDVKHKITSDSEIFLRLQDPVLFLI